MKSLQIKSFAICLTLLSFSQAEARQSDTSAATSTGVANTASIPSGIVSSSTTPPNSVQNPSSDRPPTIANLGVSGATSNVAPRSLGEISLPKEAGQQWVEYDIRPYTQQVKGVEKPQQILVDWILRETGTDVWFSEPFGILTADRDKLRVYHTPSMQKTVAKIYEKFVNGVTEPQVFGLRLITVSNPHWRSRSLGLLRPVQANSPGVSAWLMPKENGAIFLSQLRERSDAKELQAVEIPLYNGQLQYLEQLRSRNYLKEFSKNATSPFPPFIPVGDEIKEGFRLQISPLMSLDGKSADLMLKCEIDQVERLNQVKIDLPIAPGQNQTVQIEVPQVVSWRLQERFVWPTDQVLLLSCGVVAAPSGPVDNTLLSNPPNLLGLNKVLPAVGQRTDALLWLEYKGSLNTQVNTNVPSTASSTAPGNAMAVPMTSNPNSSISRGRY